MTYCTAADMIALFEPQDLVEATNLRDAAASEINMDKLNAAIDGATGLIDGYLMQAFSFPLTSSPELQRTLKIHCCNLARNLLDGSNEEVRLKANDAIEWLKMFISNQSRSGAGGDTIPGITVEEKFGTVRKDIREPFWTPAKVKDLWG